MSVPHFSWPIWINSCHTKIVDTQIHSALRIIFGAVDSTPLPWLFTLSNIVSKTTTYQFAKTLRHYVDDFQFLIKIPVSFLVLSSEKAATSETWKLDGNNGDPTQQFQTTILLSISQTPLCRCGHIQTMQHILQDKPSDEIGRGGWGCQWQWQRSLHTFLLCLWKSHKKST